MNLLFLALFLAAAPAPSRSAATPYWPGREWERRTPAQVGLDPARLDEAIAFAKANETTESRDLERAHYTGPFGREPFNVARGPFKPRGDLTGIVVRHGYIVAEWGEPDRVDGNASASEPRQVERKKPALAKRLTDERMVVIDAPRVGHGIGGDGTGARAAASAASVPACPPPTTMTSNSFG